ncbi:PKD domain-containing protein [Kribbella sp. NPDC049584]|uniref:PKD domain-containing protein n=1 Tax=Kribbella sp. NPDC049584 TaxID=3154833 RepID=UPI003447CC0E
MTVRRRSIAISVLVAVQSATGAAVVVGVPLPAAATGVESTRITNSAYTDSGKPDKSKKKAKLKLVKSGGEVTLTTEQSGRQATKSTTPSKKATKLSVPKPTSKIHTPADKRDVMPLRLNVGICGRVQSDGSVPGPVRCQLVITDDQKPSRRRVPRVVTPRPQDVRWEQVLSETKNVLFPGLVVKVNPKDRTLVNLDTIVYTDDSKVSTTTVTLLGFPVVVEATPINYTWRFGDGSPPLTTSTPGKPYPSKEITHKYMKRGDVSLTLTTTYAARFNVAGTGWQYVDGTVPITGPATPLLVREAVPVLVDPGR